MIIAMDTVLDRPLTTDSFLAWEDRREGKAVFDGQHVIASARLAGDRVLPPGIAQPLADLDRGLTFAT